MTGEVGKLRPPSSMRTRHVSLPDTLVDMEPFTVPEVSLSLGDFDTVGVGVGLRYQDC